MKFLTVFYSRVRTHKRWLITLVGVLLVSLGAPLLAAPADFSSIQTSLSNTEGHTIGLIGASSIVGGIVFFMGAIFKFHSWKQNPQQISVGQGVFLLVIGVAMVSLPFTMTTAKRALLGEHERLNQFGDSRLANVVAPPSLEDEG